MATSPGPRSGGGGPTARRRVSGTRVGFCLVGLVHRVFYQLMTIKSAHPAKVGTPPGANPGLEPSPPGSPLRPRMGNPFPSGGQAIHKYVCSALQYQRPYWATQTAGLPQRGQAVFVPVGVEL